MAGAPRFNNRIPEETRARPENVGLTSQEAQTFVLAAQGLTNSELAQVMFLSPETIKGYLKSIYRKLDVRNRAELTMHAYETGIMKPRNVPPNGGFPSESGDRILVS